MVQVKGVPEHVHRVLKARAALRGLMALLDHDAPPELGRSAAPEVRRSRERAG